VAEADRLFSVCGLWLSGLELHCVAKQRADFEHWLLRTPSEREALSLVVAVRAGFANVRHRDDFSDGFLPHTPPGSGRNKLEIAQRIELPPADQSGVVDSGLIVAQSALIESLKRQPDSVFQLSSRQFEGLIAVLLLDQGWDVELTPPTRDGGRDILAYLHTGISRILCLVEVKRYRRDRCVGVGMVRELYGVLHHNGASQAMIVTTSSFTAGARALQKQHQYQLSLHDYSVLVRWIQGYRRGRRTGERDGGQIVGGFERGR
jgi:hypothetical protein